MARSRRPGSGGTRLAGRAAFAAVAALAATAPAAHADIFAVSGSRGPPVFCEKCGTSTPASLDIALVNLNTGSRSTLPAGINTGADELRPSITPDGKRMVFMRTDAQSLRIVMVDVPTGQAADLFNGFETASRPPRSPAITPDGQVVFTGGPVRSEAGGFRAVVTATNVAMFPAGPYPHTDYGLNRFPTPDGFVDDVVANGSSTGSLVAFQREFSAGVPGLALAQLTSSDLQGVVRAGAGEFAHPALGSPGGSSTLVFDRRNGPGDAHADIVFVAANVSTFGNSTPTHLPVNTSQDETRPAFTPDGRYVAFVRTGTDGHDRLFAWDSETQTLVNSTGVDLGQVNADVGSPSLYTRSLFRLSSVSTTGVVSFSLLQATLVGILVQRVTGHHKLFGRTVPTLKLVGRVPLGQFKKGRGKAHWNLRVNGKRLRRGTYQVTPRAVTGSGKISDFGKPVMIHVRG
jgi:hypothetical protein